MEKVTIIGNGGAGKSTLAIVLGKAKRLPVYHLDQFVWKPNWQAVTEEEFGNIHKKLISEKKWVVEGLGYNSTVEDRFQHSDTIIYIDFPLRTHMLWAVKRSFKSFYKHPEGWSEGCQLIVKLPYILRIIWHVHRNTRPYIYSLVEKFRQLKIIHHISSPSHLKEFYASEIYL